MELLKSVEEKKVIFGGKKEFDPATIAASRQQTWKSNGMGLLLWIDSDRDVQVLFVKDFAVEG